MQTAVYSAAALDRLAKALCDMLAVTDSEPCEHDVSDTDLVAAWQAFLHTDDADNTVAIRARYAAVLRTKVRQAIAEQLSTGTVTDETATAVSKVFADLPRHTDIDELFVEPVYARFRARLYA